MGLRRAVKRLLMMAKPLLEPALLFEARLAEKWVSCAYHRLFDIQWRVPPLPEYMTHKVDLYYQWRRFRNSLWVERGVYSMLAIGPGANILELCCGDGFNSYFFYSKRASHIVAVDFDIKAIAYAQANFRLESVEYRVTDIRREMPRGDFDNIVWDAAIEHFTESEIEQIMKGIKERLARNRGILSGYTLVEREDGTKHLEHHEYEFKSKEDLVRFLEPHFQNVTVFETLFPERHNLYFWASDGTIPFQSSWPGMSSRSAMCPKDA